MEFFKIAIFQWVNLMADLTQCLIRAGPLSLVYLASLIFNKGFPITLRKGIALKHHIIIEKLRAHIPMTNRLRVRTEKRYKAPSDPRVKNCYPGKGQPSKKPIKTKAIFAHTRYQSLIFISFLPGNPTQPSNNLFLSFRNTFQLQTFTGTSF